MGEAEELVRTGNERRERGDLDGAIADFTRALELDPRHLEALFFRGNARLAKRDLDGAILDYDAALAISEDASLTLNRGFARHAKGDLDGALADFNRTLELDPGKSAVYPPRALILHHQRKLDLAVADYSRALEVAPTDALTWCNRGMARKDLSDFEGAIADCTRSLELDPKDPEPWRIRGIARHRKGDFAGAVADYAKTLELNPAQAYVADDLALARQEGGLFCDACVRASGGGYPGNVTSLNGLGKTFYGESDRCSTCGSVVRTLWLILFFLPLIPLASWRLLYRDFKREAIGTRETFSARSVPFAWGQVFRTWLVGLLVVAAFAGGLVALIASKKP